MAILWVMAVAVILAVILFAPERKVRPPVSKVSFETKPTRDHDVGADFASDANRHGRDHDGLMGKMVEYSKGRFIINGTATATVGGKAIDNTFIAAEFVGIVPEGTDQALVNRRFGAYTDASGRCTLHVEFPGKYICAATRSGYLPCPNIEVEVTDDAPQVKADFALSKGAQITGRVVEKTGGKGAAGIEVVATGDTWGRAKTDEEGKYTISGLTKGVYDVSLDLSGTAYLTGGKLPSKEVTLDNPDATASGVDFQVEAGGVVWGYVTTKEGEPIGRAGVLLCTSASIASQLIDVGMRAASMAGNPGGVRNERMLGVVGAQTDEKGYYELLGVGLNKEWRVITVDSDSAPQLSEPFMLSQSQRTVRVDLFVMSGTTVFGRVVTPTGEPVDGADVACVPGFSKFFSPLNRPQTFKTIRSASDGSFEMSHIPKGDYQIMAVKEGYKFALTGVPITPDGYSDLHGVDVTLIPVEEGQSQVYGTVTDGSGAPVAGAKVALANVNIEALSPKEMGTETDASGYYQFDKVSPGILALHAEKDGYTQQTITSVNLDAPTDIVMTAESRVSGRVVVYETSEVPEGASVRAIKTAAAEGGRASMIDSLAGLELKSCDETGHFEFQLPPGTYTIEGRARGMTPGRTSVTVVAGQTTGDITVHVRKSGGRIQGRVTTSTGKTPDGALVWVSEGMMSGLTGAVQDVASQVGSGGQHATMVGADGGFEFTNLAAGNYTVYARLSGFASGQSAPVQLSDGQAASGVNVRLSLGGSLQGYVLINNQPLPNVMVTIIGTSVANGAIPPMTSTDARGHYRIDNIQPGNYMAGAISFDGGGSGPFGFFSQHARVDIADGAPTTLNFGEQTNTALSGLCTPPPQGGKQGWALLHMPGNVDFSTFNFGNPAMLLQDPGGLASSLINFAQVDREGSFRMDNLPQGEYVLDVFYASIPEVMAGRIQRVFSGPVTIVNGQTAEIEVQASE